MRNISVLEFITLDGVMQAPGGPDEDTSGGFEFGGWSVPYADETSGQLMLKQMKPAELLLGRKTFEIFANYWPKHAHYWPGIMDVNKYVLTNTLKQSDPIVSQWKNSRVITSLADIQKLKDSEGDNIKVWGSNELVQLLFKNDLVDELLLKIYPLTLGKGKNLYDNGPIPAAFTLTETTVTPSGIIFANYKRAGKVKTGTVLT
ncbi:MAG: Dihydrofolate reductase [Cytophagales bacterium]|jgi:dihydrofolate reductase|nr:dihydrofolate reductase family protein [Bacteroidota bacterium]MBS1979543.1 dihydrofolate reductase family protein [Bacteroidota bacterium]WHZ09257.1 MAG: Dihydrofolate reductase [Cytophagales bacterium]